MAERGNETSPLLLARAAGLLYLVVIVLGIFTEVGVRSALIVPADAAATAEGILASEGLFRVGFLTDSLVFLSDAALAVLLYVLLRPVGRTLALVAAAFRLTQTAVLALNLLHQHAAIVLLDGAVYAGAFDAAQVRALAYLFLDLHAHGYDLGLLFFGAHCLVLGYLVARSGYLPGALGGLLMAAAFAYLTGTYTRFLLPGRLGLVQPVYLVAVVAEVAFCGWLLVKGIRLPAWEARTGEGAPS